MFVLPCRWSTNPGCRRKFFSLYFPWCARELSLFFEHLAHEDSNPFLWSLPVRKSRPARGLWQMPVHPPLRAYRPHLLPAKIPLLRLLRWPAWFVFPVCVVSCGPLFPVVFLFVLVPVEVCRRWCLTCLTYVLRGF